MYVDVFVYIVFKVYWWNLLIVIRNLCNFIYL